MSLRRLAGTTAGLLGAGVLLWAGTPDPAPLVAAGGNLQALADTAGPDVLVLAVVAGLAWLAWAWAALGLLLMALSAAPGLLGAAAAAAARLVLPSATRRAAALALGLGLSAVPALGACAAAAPPPAATVAAADRTPAALPASGLPTTGPAPDWPAAAEPDRPAAAPPRNAVPDWPPVSAPPHVVVRGDCLWDVAAADLRARTATEPTDREIAVAVQAWWAANAEVIGPDPDLLHPGQVLHPPAGSADPAPESER